MLSRASSIRIPEHEIAEQIDASLCRIPSVALRTGHLVRANEIWLDVSFDVVKVAGLRDCAGKVVHY
jgi:hypothetical protein